MNEEVFRPEECKHDGGVINTLHGPKCCKCGRFIVKDEDDSI